MRAKLLWISPLVLAVLLLVAVVGCSQGDQVLEPTVSDADVEPDLSLLADSNRASTKTENSAAVPTTTERETDGTASEASEQAIPVVTQAPVVTQTPVVTHATAITQATASKTLKTHESDSSDTIMGPQATDTVSPSVPTSDPSSAEPVLLSEQSTVVSSVSSQATVRSGDSPGLRNSTQGVEDEQRLRPLHVDVDGDSAVIVSDPSDGVQGVTAQRSEESLGLHSQSRGEMFTWHDGDNQVPVWQDTQLTVADIIGESGWGDPSGPVFWSESNELMALPGGVVLILDPGWGVAAVDAFMESNKIAPDEAIPFEGLINAFKLETAPGLPSLLRANALAGQSGVVISSPNWWISGLVQ